MLVSLTGRRSKKYEHSAIDLLDPLDPLKKMHETPLHFAVLSENRTKFDLIISELKQYEKDETTEYSFEERRKNIAKYLNSYIETNGRTVLHIMSALKKEVFDSRFCKQDIIDLIEFGAEPGLADMSGHGSLFLSCSNANKTMVEAIISSNKDCCFKSVNGVPFSVISMYSGDFGFFEYVLDEFPDMFNVEDRNSINGKTVLEYSLEYCLEKSHKMEDLQKNMKLLSIILKRKPNLYASDSKNRNIAQVLFDRLILSEMKKQIIFHFFVELLSAGFECRSEFNIEKTAEENGLSDVYLKGKKKGEAIFRIKKENSHILNNSDSNWTQTEDTNNANVIFER